MNLPTFSQISAALRRTYGAPKPIPKSAFEWVLWENCCYLANDAKRAQAFALLKRTVGLNAKAILRAPMSKLLAVSRHGIVPELFARKLKLCAEIALGECDGDVDGNLPADTARATSKLRLFPGVGAPSAERMLASIGRLRVLALDSNGLRVLQRIGFAKALKSYSAMYRSVQSAVPIGRATAKQLFATALLLQRHGRAICKTTRPNCGICRLRTICSHGQTVVA